MTPAINGAEDKPKVDAENIPVSESELRNHLCRHALSKHDQLGKRGASLLGPYIRTKEGKDLLPSSKVLP